MSFENTSSLRIDNPLHRTTKYRLLLSDIMVQACHSGLVHSRNCKANPGFDDYVWRSRWMDHEPSFDGCSSFLKIKMEGVSETSSLHKNLVKLEVFWSSIIGETCVYSLYWYSGLCQLSLNVVLLGSLSKSSNSCVSWESLGEPLLWRLYPQCFMEKVLSWALSSLPCMTSKQMWPNVWHRPFCLHIGLVEL